MGSDESAAPEKAAFWGPLGSWVSKREEEASNEPAIESMPETLDPDHAAYWIPCHPWMNKREDASAYARDFRARELCPMV
ncbi:hypothetical protein L226DRAFT_534354 [Lentinus tigrinus ALCF2SS1-7]|uniref:uncharacterized protein n=1 Tax=Lentinus tigrinus ALCF2SS1-7 TaxID=1328758 RepID=UPI0011663080|nr:hypothetical protein L226DRAFT_534354 [Lentinus tigrinus ALCF2SS1-7]